MVSVRARYEGAPGRMSSAELSRCTALCMLCMLSCLSMCFHHVQRTKQTARKSTGGRAPRRDEWYGTENDGEEEEEEEEEEEVRLHIFACVCCLVAIASPQTCTRRPLEVFPCSPSFPWPRCSAMSAIKRP